MTEPRQLPYYELVAQTLAAVGDKLLRETPEMDAIICVPVYKVPNQQLAPGVLRFSTQEAANSVGTNLRAAMQLCDSLLVQATRTKQILQSFDTVAAQMAADIAAKQKLLEELEGKLNGAKPQNDGGGGGGETTPQS